MFNPISTYKNDYLELTISTDKIKERFICQHVENFHDANNSFACRYQLKSELNDKNICLEVKKDRAHNYQMFYYEIIEEVSYNPTFLALLGSTTIGYNNPYTQDDEQIIYNIIPRHGERLISIKHIVTKDELPINPKEIGYNKDANNNWYFMANQSEGSVKKFANGNKQRSWEYKNNQDRLLIEIQNDCDIYSNIMIYEGKEISRRDLRKIEAKEWELA